jgi:hypothetical protein
MLNLNYNLIGAGTKQNRDIGGFAPSIRQDQYSSSIVLAIPGALFREGYDNLFGMTNIFSDVSAYVKGNGVPSGNNYVIVPTGSLVTGSSNLVKWDSQGYNTALYVEDGAVGSVTSSANTGVNLSTSSNWCVEAWVAFSQTSSATTPYHRVVWKQEGGNAFSVDSYAMDIFSGTVSGNFPQSLPNPFPASNQSGSLRIITDSPSTENIYYATSSAASNPIIPTQWNHIAYSYTKDDKGLSDRNVFRAFWNGRMIIEQQPDGSQPLIIQNGINQFPDKPAELMGTTSGSGYTPTFFQDFRMYNGTNKNYTSSFDVNIVESIVIGRP